MRWSSFPFDIACFKSDRLEFALIMKEEYDATGETTSIRFGNKLLSFDNFKQGKLFSLYAIYISLDLLSSLRSVQGSLKDLKALASIINDSISRIEQVAIAQNLSFPSLDTAYSKESEKIRTDPVVEEATFTIISAATRLLATARPAHHSVLANILLVGSISIDL